MFLDQTSRVLFCADYGGSDGCGIPVREPRRRNRPHTRHQRGNRRHAGGMDFATPSPQITPHGRRIMIAISAIAVTGFGIALTAGAYSLSLLARKCYPSPLTTPVLFSTVIIIAVLLATGITFADYQPAKNIMTFLLVPATVALAIPLYKNRRTFFGNLVPAGAGVLAGSLGTMISAVFLARIFGFTPELVSSIAIKSTTVPIAVEVARIVHGSPTLTAVLVVITGMLGASFGP